MSLNRRYGCVSMKPVPHLQHPMVKTHLPLPTTVLQCPPRPLNTQMGAALRPCLMLLTTIRKQIIAVEDIIYLFNHTLVIPLPYPPTLAKGEGFAKGEQKLTPTLTLGLNPP
ncbi:hypothetical protein LXA43DRAFT_1064166 [Ganoderma leucocontextum]|nr:hypothetical protein LXA43DRAFT_1064166 [Ganoderma leucocontextum]